MQPLQFSSQQSVTGHAAAGASAAESSPGAASYDVEVVGEEFTAVAADAADTAGVSPTDGPQSLASPSSSDSSFVVVPDLTDEPGLPGMILGSADRPATTVPTAPMRILFLIMRFCDGTDSGPVTTATEFDSILFANGSATTSGGAPESAAASIGFQALFNYCGNGRPVLSRENVRILEDVRVPCTGNTTAATSLYGSYTWRTGGCSWPDLFGWGEAAAELARARLGDTEFDRYKHVVMLMPRGWKAAADPQCANFVSGAEVGVWRRTAAGQPAFALTAVSDERYNEAALYLHELLHNFNLWHAGGYDVNGAACEYCDWSCVLGWCCNVRCPNAAHMWALGWAGPVAGGRLSLAGLTEGAVQSFRVPLQHTGNDSMVLIDATNDAGKGLQYFLSYRRSGALYERMYGAIDGVHVHVRYAGGAAPLIPQIGTMQLRRLQRAGGVWQDEDSRLMVSVAAMTTADATVTLCRAPLRTRTTTTATTSNATTNSTASGASAVVNTLVAPVMFVDWSACSLQAPRAAAARAAPPLALSPPSPDPPSPEPPSLPPPSPRRSSATATKRAPPLPPLSSIDDDAAKQPSPSPPSPSPSAPLSPHKKRRPPPPSAGSPSKRKSTAGGRRRRQLLRGTVA
ncbi:hypothetical protein HYH02_008076 [Chlamydomonas schloesseri]|uniref:Peptidase M11 gametolysin domain-containing protein n=1 Tax=Chlamydomonas schloesseri TaxID=2026947 RepID=A0A835WGB2_9CHLO|nr:hypothetical protein HYH02_008076 [Chlamydomonas schloesseri]|eukprot:KAG2446920.1 hypothetical protein HYH02_008076 [Chlamydomonas schloesseri]